MSSKFNIINLALRRLGQDPISALSEDTENYRKVDDIYDLTLRSFLRSHPWNFAKKEVALSRTISMTTAAWVTATDYKVGDYVKVLGVTYVCLIEHTAGVWAVDLAAAYWEADYDYETSPLGDYTYIFNLPTDFLKLNKTDLESSGYAHKIKGHKLYSNSDEINIEYIAYTGDPDAWVTLTAYIVGDYVLQSNTIYYCQEDHTAGTFATDLTAGYWVAMDIYDAAFTDAFATLLAYDLCMPITNNAALKEILKDEFRLKFNLAKSYNGMEQTPDTGIDSDWLNSRI